MVADKGVSENRVICDEYCHSMWRKMSLLFRTHPWHGIPIGDNFPNVVNSYIETVPTDTVKYEIDKHAGFLKVDRPQKYSSVCPALYGFIPQTFCSNHIAEFCRERTGRSSIVGDDDPLDICVLSERNLGHGDVIIHAIPIGGFRMIDRGQADDKIIAVMQGDNLYHDWKDIDDCPKSFIDRLKHYFLTYKELPGSTDPICEITDVYDRKEAFEVIRRSREDYLAEFSELDDLLVNMKKWDQ